MGWTILLLGTPLVSGPKSNSSTAVRLNFVRMLSIPEEVFPVHNITKQINLLEIIPQEMVHVTA